MTNSLTAVAHLSDHDLLAEVAVVATREREATARLIALLAQLDERRLYLGEGYSSLFTYCTQVLHLSEHAAYGRIEAARAARRYPIVLDLLTDGFVTLTAVTLLASHLTPDNYREVLADLTQAKFAAGDRPRASRQTVSGSRHIPAAVRRAVWKRDGGQCAFVGTHGRCTERGFLEFHHLEPYAVGGPAVVENVALRCRAHNVYEAERYFGDRLPLLREALAPAYCCHSVRTE